MATHSSILAWKIPWTEEPGRLLSMRSQRVGHDLATSFLNLLKGAKIIPSSLCLLVTDSYLFLAKYVFQLEKF